MCKEFRTNTKVRSMLLVNWVGETFNWIFLAMLNNYKTNLARLIERTSVALNTTVFMWVFLQTLLDWALEKTYGFKEKTIFINPIPPATPKIFKVFPLGFWCALCSQKASPQDKKNYAGTFDLHKRLKLVQLLALSKKTYGFTCVIANPKPLFAPWS